MKSVPLSLSAVMLLGLFGCHSTGMSVRETGSNNVSNYLLALTETPGPAEGRSIAPVTPPIRLAVAQVGEVAPSAALMRALQERGDLFASVQTIPAASAPDYVPRLDTDRTPHDAAREHMENLCRMARSLGSDYMLLYGGNIDHATVRNGLGVLNLTVVGGFFVPSRELRGEGKASAALIDLRTRQIVHLISATSQDKRISAAFTDDAARLSMLEQMRDTLSADLAAQLIERVQRGAATR